jgi:hypothetical protein
MMHYRLPEMLTAVGGEGIKDLLREVVRDALQGLIEEELTATIGAAKHERTDTRTAQRNGGRDRVVSTPAGDVELKIPKLRKGSFFPELLEPGRPGKTATELALEDAYRASFHVVSPRGGLDQLGGRDLPLRSSARRAQSRGVLEGFGAGV